MGLAFEVYGAAPVQASGSVGTRTFYFHARHSNWSFEMADDLGELPTDTGNNPVFSVHGRHRDAGEMPLDEASKIIEACARLFLSTTAPNL
ncbi:MAG TPA: hypothetical protein VF796_30955 [Humisphaera sp.]